MDLLENGEPVEEGARVANVAENRLDWSADDPAVLKAIDILSHCLASEYAPRRVLDQRGLLRKSRSATREARPASGSRWAGGSATDAEPGPSSAATHTAVAASSVKPRKGASRRNSICSSGSSGQLD